jgi:hypothetical protein
MNLVPDKLRAFFAASDVETIRIEDAFKEDINARIKPPSEPGASDHGDLYQYELEILSMYNDVEAALVASFNETKEKCAEPSKLRVGITSIGGYFDKDLILDGKHGPYHKNGVVQIYASFGLGLGLMIGLLEHNFEYIFMAIERYEQLLEKLKKHHPSYFEFFRKQARATIADLEKSINPEDQKRKKLEILKGVLASCGAL